MSEHLRSVAREIFAATLRSVDVRGAVRSRIQVQPGQLVLAGKAVALEELDSALVLAMGKAAVPMYEAAAEALQDVVPHQAMVIAPQETLPPDEMISSSSSGRVRFLPGEHPTPGERSLLAADEALRLLADADGRAAVLFLVSGGASAMVEKPLDPAVTLEETAAFYRSLVRSGMDIARMNALRKHFSAVKGGRMARAAAAARLQVSLLVSDVPDSKPDAIASGPSLPDPTTVDECQILFRRLQESSGQLPERIVRFFEDEAMPETPKPGDPEFARSHFEVVLSGGHLERAAAQAAVKAGFPPVIDNTCDDWEYREAGGYLLDRAAELAQRGRRACLISVGEVGVAVGANPGEGGRNQQFALWCAAEAKRRGMRVTVLSAGTDGIDGHSSSAGAVCDETSAERAQVADFEADAALAGFDAGPVLRAIGDAVVTGPTGNNLRDLRLILVE